jgi:hypothetical protein
VGGGWALAKEKFYFVGGGIPDRWRFRVWFEVVLVDEKMNVFCEEITVKMTEL